jgi:cbb3-type cytochrome oxidase maturation protein
MNVIFLMIPISLTLAVGFLTAFVWAVRTGQIDDLETPAHRIIDDNDEVQNG